MKAVPKHKRVLQTGSMQRSMNEFRVACELVRNGVIGKIQKVECSFGDPGRPCDLPEESMEPGLDWNLWCGPAPLRGYSSVLSPRGIHKYFPDWRDYMEYGSGAGGRLGRASPRHRPVGPRHGRQRPGGGHSAGRPGRQARRQTGLCQRRHCGTQRRIRRAISLARAAKCGSTAASSCSSSTARPSPITPRKRKRSRPRGGNDLRREVHKAETLYLANARVKLYVSKQHISDFMALRQEPQETHHQRAGRRPLRHLLPSDQPVLLPPRAPEVGSRPLQVHRRHRRPEMADPRLSRALVGLSFAPWHGRS